MVKPIMLGKIVERRDGRCAGASCLAHRFLYLLRTVQVNKRTFLEERGMAYPLKLLLRRRTMNLSVRLLLRVFLRWSERPAGYRVLTKVTTTTTMWVVYWSSSVPARTRGRTNATPACSTCFYPERAAYARIASFARGLHGSLLHDFTHFTRTQTRGDA